MGRRTPFYALVGLALGAAHSTQRTAHSGEDRVGAVRCALCAVRCALAFGGALGMLGSLPRAQADVVRTLVYHQVTSFQTSDPKIQNGPFLSGNGTRVVYTTFTRPGAQDTARNNTVVVNADGTGSPQVVDSYAPLTGDSPHTDISADGSKVVSTDNEQLRVANTSGGSAVKLGQTDGTIVQFHITPDGSKVFFQLRADTTWRPVSGSAVSMPRGVWVINTDGSGLRQVAGADRVASLLGRTVDKIFTFETNGPALGVSSDGSRVVFGTHIGGEDGLFAVGGDGSGLRRLDLGTLQSINHAGISGDGTKVFYDITPPPFGSPSEIGVINFDGSGRLPLLTQNSPALREARIGWPNGGDPVQMSPDGSKLFVSGIGLRFDLTPGAAAPLLALAAPGGFFTGPPPPLIGDGLFQATMNSQATRFVYRSGDANGVTQLATLDLNPTALGAAPAIGSPKVNPTSILTRGGSNATVSAAVSAGGTLIVVNYAVLRGGLWQRDGFRIDVMWDDGTHGDAVKGDGIFTDNQLSTTSGYTVAGAHTLRIGAESRTADGRRHASAVDIEPFSVAP